MPDGLVAELIVKMAGEGSKGSGNTGDTGAGGFFKTLVNQGKGAAKHANQLAKRSVGINFSVAAILKQSQLFTGMVGSLFQILGALADV